MYTCKVVSNERLVFKESLELPAYVYTIVKHYHFTIFYSKKIISARSCPDAHFWLPQKAKNVKFSGASPLGPLGGSQRPQPPSCCKLATLPTGAPLVVLALLTFEIRQVLLCIRQSLCSRPEPLVYNALSQNFVGNLFWGENYEIFEREENFERRKVAEKISPKKII